MMKTEGPQFHQLTLKTQGIFRESARTSAICRLITSGLATL